MTCLLFLRYPHNALRFTNHVGEQRNFCKQKCDVPLLVCLSNSTLSAQRSAYFFKTLYGTTFPHTARIHKFMNNQTLPLRAGCRGRQPLHLVQTNSLCRKIATLFADFTLCYGIEKAVQSFFYSDTALILLLVCFSSIAFLNSFGLSNTLKSYLLSKSKLAVSLISNTLSNHAKYPSDPSHLN